MAAGDRPQLLLRRGRIPGARGGAPRAGDPDDWTGAVAAPEGEQPLAAAIREQQAGALEAVLGALAPDFREVLVLREIEDLSYREIAEVIGAPVGTVMSRLARARAALRAAWTDDEGGPDHDLR